MVALMVPGKINEDACAEVDDFLRTHHGVEWIGVFEPALVETPKCRDLIVDQLFDYRTTPVDAARLVMTLGHALGRAVLRWAMQANRSPGRDLSIVGNSAAARELLRQILRVAKVNAPVLVCGESGSGKELTAQAIHCHSSRADGPVRGGELRCDSGHVDPVRAVRSCKRCLYRSYSAGWRAHRGLIKAANGGTIVLDEIGDLALDQQINLLRFLQEKTINRVGSTKSIHVDARVIAAAWFGAGFHFLKRHRASIGLCRRE